MKCQPKDQNQTWNMPPKSTYNNKQCEIIDEAEDEEVKAIYCESTDLSGMAA